RHAPGRAASASTGQVYSVSQSQGRRSNRSYLATKPYCPRRRGDRMRRREFITLVGGTAAWPHILAAQRIDRSRRIGVLMDFAANDPQAQSNVEALQGGLYKLGWSQGNLGIDYRWARGDAVLVWKFAKELVES